MAKEPLDHAHETGDGRVRNYTEQDRQDGTHPAVDELTKRPHERGEGNRKMQEYLRIDRGDKA
ncbi:hypothetical protein [Paracoccus jiaweipingae]|uniref:hypothetical protein n=1 Tax=unclassified Paracoccus (in: a-proteobacteria) TaxID=2688777 RepID=UPI0037AA2E99